MGSWDVGSWFVRFVTFMWRAHAVRSVVHDVRTTKHTNLITCRTYEPQNLREPAEPDGSVLPCILCVLCVLLQVGLPRCNRGRHGPV